MEHRLKIWPKFANAIELGVKRFELRRNDRPFKVGDTLHLEVWDPERKAYTGHVITKNVTYVLDLADFIKGSNHVVMSIGDIPSAGSPS